MAKKQNNPIGEPTPELIEPEVMSAVVHAPDPIPVNRLYEEVKKANANMASSERIAELLEKLVKIEEYRANIERIRLQKEGYTITKLDLGDNE